MINLVRAMTLALVVAFGPTLAKAQPAMSPTGQATLSVSGSSASVALPTSGSIVTLFNDGTSQIYWKMGISSVVATTNDFPLPAGACRDYAVVGQSTIAAISGGTSTLRVTRGNGTAAGGSCGGGSGGGGGGGGPVTLAAGSVSLGAYVAGSLVDGAIATLGTTSDVVCATATGTCTLEALFKYLNVIAGSSIPAGAAIIGNIRIDQTTPGNTNNITLSSLPRAARNFPGCTVGVTSASCLAASTAVSFLQVQNTHATANIACAFGVAAVLNSSTSFELAAGQSASWGPTTGGVPTGAMNCISSVASTPLYVEWL